MLYLACNHFLRMQRSETKASLVKNKLVRGQCGKQIVFSRLHLDSVGAIPETECMEYHMYHQAAYPHLK